jgi:hypothetical protein
VLWPERLPAASKATTPRV